MSEAQGTQLIELVDGQKQFIEGSLKLQNSILYGVLAALIAIAFFSALRAVRRG